MVPTYLIICKRQISKKKVIGKDKHDESACINENLQMYLKKHFFFNNQIQSCME